MRYPGAAFEMAFKESVNKGLSSERVKVFGVKLQCCSIDGCMK